MGQERIGSMGSLSIQAMQGLLGLGSSVFTARVTQSGADDPVITEIYSSMPTGEISIERTGIGTYNILSASGLFTENTIVRMFHAELTNALVIPYFICQYIDANTISLECIDIAAFILNDIIGQTIGSILIISTY